MFNVPDDLSKVFERDRAVAGIAKKDDRGRTLDVHALRHTFGTMLSKAGVSPRVAQAAMRHSSLELAMNVYMDPRLLDVQGAIESLPEFSVTKEPAENRQRIAAGAESSVAVTVAVDADFSSVSQSTPVTLSANSSELSGSAEMRRTPQKSAISGSSLKGGQAGSNRRPSDPQSGATSCKPTKLQRVAKRRSRRCSNGCSNSPENERGEAGGPGVPNVGGELVSSKSESLPIEAGSVNNAGSPTKADSFSAAPMLIASLPLSDAEKAEAVRRLMAEREG